MTPEAFCYWLQGFAELGSPPPTAAQWKMIKEHLSTVFIKVTEPLPMPPMLPMPPLFPAPDPWPFTPAPRPALPDTHPLQPNDWPPGPNIYC